MLPLNSVGFDTVFYPENWVSESGLNGTDISIPLSQKNHTPG